MDWPFGDVAYADMMEAVVDRFDTGNKRDLVGVYDQLIGNDTCDPFEDSGAAVNAFEAAEWLPLVNCPTLLLRRRRASVLQGRALMWTPGDQSPAIGW